MKLSPLSLSSQNLASRGPKTNPLILSANTKAKLAVTSKATSNSTPKIKPTSQLPKSSKTALATARSEVCAGLSLIHCNWAG
jgi:hypothetical protein